MKQTIEIEVPDGKKAVWKDNKVVFEDITPQLPKTWEEFCSKYQNSEYFIGNSEILRVPLGYHYDKNSDKDLLPTKKAAEQHLALMQLHQLRDCYRQGWQPDWRIKYYIGHYDAENYSVYASCITPAFLSFQSKELAEKFLNNFHDLIKEAGDLI